MRVALLSTILALCAAILPVSAQAVQQSYQLNIPRQPLDGALKDLAQQTGLQIARFSDTQGGTALVGPVSGDMSVGQALTSILNASGLTYKVVNDRTIAVIAQDAEKGDQPATAQSAQAAASVDTETSKEGKKDSSDGFRVAQVDQTNPGPQAVKEKSQEERKQPALEEIVVTGTHIRGEASASPIVDITQDQILLAGQTDLGEAIRSVPQNFGGGQNPGVGLGANANPINQNLTSGSSANLRGLGPDATLTLLNGRRLPYDGINQAVDISSIPVAAVDRIQVLLDGASAVYGSDAVAGVTNVVLKKDYDGLSATAGYGLTTDKGDSQVEFSGLGGSVWGGGGFLLAANFERNSGVYPYERDFANYMPAHNTLYPPISQKNVLISGHQALSDWLTLTVDSLYGARSTTLLSDFGFETTTDDISTRTWWLSPTLSLTLPGAWVASLNGSISRDNASFDAFASAATPVSHNIGCYCNSEHSAELDAEGPIVALPGGDLRASIGGGYRHTSFSYDNLELISSTPADIDGSRSNYYGFAEVAIPVVSHGQGVPLVDRLTFNAAIRYEHYSDFGDVSKPKFGLVWGLMSGFDVKGTWGKSFKAPTLYQEYSPVQAILFPGALFNVTSPPDATVLFANGGNRNLQPEQATTYNLSVAIHPQTLEGFLLETGYFHIDYTNRVVTPIGANPFSVLTNPALSPFIVASPTLAQQQSVIDQAGPGQFIDVVGVYDPTKVADLIYNQNTNFAHQFTDGVDLSVNYKLSLLGGTLTAQAYATWMEGWSQLTAASPRVQTIGTIFNPPHVRGRGGLAWQRAGLTLATYINYVGDLTDTRNEPNAHVASLTTLDGAVDYKTPEGKRLSDTLEVNLSIINVFDRDPPFIQPVPAIYPNYDSTNYTAVGRFVNLTVSKRW